MTPTHVQQYLAEARDYSRQTVANRLFAIRSLYNYRGGNDPTVGLKIRRGKTEPNEPFEDSDLTQLLAACLSERDRALLLFLLASGCRRQEVSKMRLRDVDWPKGRVLIHGKRNKRRWVTPGKSAMTCLAQLVGNRKDGGSVWVSRQGGTLTGARIYDAVQRIAARAGVVDAHPHRFRVTFAVKFLRQYGNIEALRQVLGHDDIRTTEVYATYDYAQRALVLQDRLDLAKHFRAMVA